MLHRRSAPPRPGPRPKATSSSRHRHRERDRAVVQSSAPGIRLPAAKAPRPGVCPCKDARKPSRPLVRGPFLAGELVSKWFGGAGSVMFNRTAVGPPWLRGLVAEPRLLHDYLQRGGPKATRQSSSGRSVGAAIGCEVRRPLLAPGTSAGQSLPHSLQSCSVYHCCHGAAGLLRATLRRVAAHTHAPALSSKAPRGSEFAAVRPPPNQPYHDHHTLRGAAGPSWGDARDR